MKLCLAIALATAACLQVPEAAKPECTSDSDCETSLGEVCNAGTCYGGPPAGTYAATLTPPSDRPDLTSTEIPSLQLPANGDLGTFALEAPVRISGRIEAFCPSGSTTCTSTSLAATVVVSRTPLFPGGTGFSASTTSKGGLPHGTTSFSVAVPVTHAGEPPYVVTFTPAGGGLLPPPNGSPSDAELAPPGSQTIAVSANTDLGTLTLGSATSAVISGQLTDSGGHPLVKYRVVARGRLVAGGPITDVSTVDYTTTGAYSLTIADSAVSPIAIVATPYDTNTAPTLTLPGLDVHSATRTITQPPNLGNKVDVSIPIVGLLGSGAIGPVVGAHVTVTGTYAAPITGGTNAALFAETTTSDDGLAHLTLLDGATLSASYILNVIPPASSELGVVYGQALPLDTIAGIRLPARIELRGHVLDTTGKPVGRLSVTAKPSLRFLWSAPPDLAAFIAEIPAPTAVTDPAGDYAIYVDRSVDLFPDTLWGHYDLELDAPAGVAIASWTLYDIEIPRDPSLQTLDIPDATLPDTSYLHGQLADPNHLRVSDGELRIFAISTDRTLCSQVPYPPTDCAVPAQLAGHAASGDDGTLKLALPR
ncbi:MAG: hypothetical protein ABJE66_33890 [Deltaproteobacteria bacterium]